MSVTTTKEEIAVHMERRLREIIRIKGRDHPLVREAAINLCQFVDLDPWQGVLVQPKPAAIFDGNVTPPDSPEVHMNVRYRWQELIDAMLP